MKEPSRSFSFQIPEMLLKKLKYIAKYECRSTGSTLRVLIQTYTAQFEKEHGEIR